MADSGKLLRVAVIGFGTMGRKHTGNCSRIEGVEVAAVVGVDEAEAEIIKAEAKVPAYTDADMMLAEVPLDALILATPPGVRRETVMAAANMGKALFLEKPIALNLPTAREYCDIVKKQSLVNAVGFQLRYSPLTEQARQMIKGRTVTHVRTACTTSYYLKRDVPDWFLQRKHSGGPLLEQAIHPFDIARLLVGEITNVFARAERLLFADTGELDSEDTIVLAYRFASGTLGTHVDSCAMTEFNWEVELLGSDWRLLVDYARKRLTGHIGEETIEQDFPDIDLHLLEMQAFIEAVRSHKPDMVRSDFADATRTLAVVLAGDRSIKTGAWEAVEEV
ncbi:MAG: Gfo/Idh/MocA family oxidoreductase [Dehalococcoidales bacterium]|nr:MAG: Gfo/Idh/MocA family oxidoreductase [Dehalococcoidales bacterium]